MKKDRININKALIPYKFSIALNDTNFTFEVRHNNEADLFVIGLYDRNGQLICTEPVIYGSELFARHYQPGIYPSIRIVPLDDSGANTAVTWQNFNETVFLTIENTGDKNGQ